MASLYSSCIKRATMLLLPVLIATCSTDTSDSFAPCSGCTPNSLVQVGAACKRSIGIGYLEESASASRQRYHKYDYPYALVPLMKTWSCCMNSTSATTRGLRSRVSSTLSMQIFAGCDDFLGLCECIIQKSKSALTGDQADRLCETS